MADDPDHLWRLKVRHGKLTTPYKHFSIIADGHIVDDRLRLNLTPGPAFMAMKVWALSVDEACAIMADAADHSGFALKGETQVYDTDPYQPPRSKPYGYDIKLTSYTSPSGR